MIKLIQQPATRLIGVLVLIASSTIVKAQDYKTAADTIKLNEEYRKVSADMADLNKQLTEDRSKLPNYQSKSDQDANQAQSAAQASEQQAAKASDADLKNVKKEEKKAKKANEDAEDAKDARNRLTDLNKEIKKLSAKLDKKQKRLDELNKEKSAIMSQTAPAGS